MAAQEGEGGRGGRGTFGLAEKKMGKHGTRGHKKSTTFSNSTSGGLGYTLNKELRKQFSGTHKAGVDGAAMSTRHTTVDDGGALQSVTEVRACQTSANTDECHCVLHTLVRER